MSMIRWFAAGGALALVTAVAAVTGRAQDAAPPAGDKATFVGDKQCQKCHFQAHKSWKKTRLAKSMKSLGPTAEADNKELFEKKKASGLDPAKDYTADEKCVKCHVTGYGSESGYPKDPKANEEATKRAAMFGVVGCEACHGAGSKYVAFKSKDENKDRKDIPFEELAPLGLVKPDEALCKTCHNAESPIKEDFKFEEMKDKTHDKEKKQ